MRSPPGQDRQEGQAELWARDPELGRTAARVRAVLREAQIDVAFRRSLRAALGARRPGWRPRPPRPGVPA